MSPAAARVAGGVAKGYRHRGTVRLLLVLLAVLLTAACRPVAAGPSAPVDSAAAEPSPGTHRPSGALSSSSAPSSPVHQRRAPNIVVITTDDQNADELRWMPRTRALLADAGMTFTHALSPHPLCCPARAELLTGQYAQNNGVQHNHGPRGGFPALRDQPTLPAWLQRAGYRTVMVGKYLNGYDASAGRQPGWTVWNPMVTGIYNYEGTAFLRGGRPRTPAGYSVDVVGDLTDHWIRRLAGGRRPFFVWSSQVAPHDRAATTGWLPPTWPRREDGDPTATRAGRSTPALGKPSYGRPSAFARRTCECLTASWSRQSIRAAEAARVRALRAVDDAVASTVQTLRRAGVLDTTWIFFSSDNGVLLGEHGLVGKNVLYDEALHVPLLVRGPGVRPGSRSAMAVTWADLAPTIAAIAGLRPLVRVDGASFLPLLRGRPAHWRDTQLVQTGRWGGDGWAYRGVRTRRYTLAVQQSTGRVVLFDRRRDPFELVDQSAQSAYAAVRSELLRRTRLLVDCAGASCRRSFGPLPPVGRR